jgi:signal transduction histidine kinase
MTALPRIRHLSLLLVASHAGLVLLLALLLLLAGGGTIRAAIQQRAQVQATRSAAEALARLADQRREVAVVAGLLAERPTLQRQVERSQRVAAQRFLAAFLQASQVDYLRVEHGGQAFAEAGKAPPSPGAAGLQVDPGDGSFWIVEAQASAPAGTRVLAARRIAASTIAGSVTGDEQLALLAADARAARAGGDVAAEAAYRHVRATGVAETLGRSARHAALRIEPVRGDDGDVAALLTLAIPASAARRDTLAWLGAFALSTLLAATAAALLAAWIARRIAQPFAALARASERLAVGDLATPVPVPATSLQEPLMMARNLEGMRRDLRLARSRERRQRQDLEAVLDGVEDGIVALDGEGTIRYANRAFLALVDRDAQDVAGAAFHALLVPLPGDAAAAAPASAAAALPVLPAGGSQRTGRFRAGERELTLVLRTCRALVQHQVVMVHEQTSIEIARAMRDAVVANLSHEFQTPLAAQIASIELLLDHLRASGDAIAVQLAESQSRGALRLSQLVENLLDSVRLESGEMRLRRDAVELPALVRSAVDLMRPLIAQREQQVVLDLPAQERSLRGDARRLSQVVVNLLANANKFAPDQSTIRVELAWEEDTVALWVEDEGPGLPPLGRHADLFAPFRRAPGEEPSQRGTGLGLAIARALVERHQGRVVLAAARHGSGARIGVVLPLEPRIEVDTA